MVASMLPMSTPSSNAFVAETARKLPEKSSPSIFLLSYIIKKYE
jgi:hypothetical protein